MKRRWPEPVRILVLFNGMSWKADPVEYVLYRLLLAAAVACLGLVSIALRAWVNAIIQTGNAFPLAPATLFVASLALPLLLDRGGFYMLMNIREKFVLAVERSLLALSVGIPTIEHFERADYLREMELLVENRGALASLVSSFNYNVNIFSRLALVVALLGWIHPLLLLLPLFAFPAVWVEGRMRMRRLSLEDSLAETKRLERYYESLAITAEPGRELRIFNLGQELCRRFLGLRSGIDGQEDRERVVGGLATASGWLVFATGFAGALAYLAVLVSSGHASVGDMVMAITLAIQLSVLVPTVAAGNSELAEIFRAGKRYLWLADYAERVKAQFSLPESQPAPTALREGIRLEDLSLSYGGDEHFALEDLSVHLPAGSIVAIVGENGAGKTTLVKLLSRMYQPAKGAIFVNEVNLQTIEVDSWRSRITAGFQDFVRLELLAREGVGVGDLARIHDAPAVEQALVRAEAGDVVAGLPNGLETQLGRSFDGAELSGGQWQKMALARAMMRPAPLLVLLDEPTAALDAEAEYALFQRYAVAARGARETSGAITILVTHRFSNVRMCDLILVLASGRLVEHGTHDELLAARGLYAELYELQARQYR